MIEFDFDNLSKLASKNPAAFEIERKRLLAAQLREIPESNRAKCEALQAELDFKRATMSPEKFMLELNQRLQENLADLNDQLQAISAMSEKDSNAKPHLDTINRIVYAGSRFTGKQ